MHTKRLDTSLPAIAMSGELLRCGELIAFPTETVYGLGRHAIDEHAGSAIFTAKGRLANDSLIVHITAVTDPPLVALTVLTLAGRLLPACRQVLLTPIVPPTLVFHRQEPPDVKRSRYGYPHIRLPKNCCGLPAYRLLHRVRTASDTPVQPLPITCWPIAMDGSQR